MILTLNQILIACAIIDSSLKDNEKIAGVNLFRLSYNVAQLEPHAARFEAVRNNLIKTLGKEGENGQISVERDSPAFGEFVAEIERIVKEEIEIDIKPIEIGFINGDLLSVSDMSQIIWMFTE